MADEVETPPAAPAVAAPVVVSAEELQDRANRDFPGCKFRFGCVAYGFPWLAVGANGPDQAKERYALLTGCGELPVTVS